MSAAEDINNDTNKCYFLVVPHSAYYSCLLLMKHLCYKKFGINNENEMKNEIDSTLHGSHEIMIGYVRKRMTQSCTSIMDKKKVVEFASKIGQLKKLRTKADYEDTRYYYNLQFYRDKLPEGVRIEQLRQMIMDAQFSYK